MIVAILYVALLVFAVYIFWRLLRKGPHELRVGEKPPFGTECGLCRDRCPECFVRYGDDTEDTEHAADCKLTHVIEGCPHDASTIVDDRGRPLPLCRIHANGGLV